MRGLNNHQVINVTKTAWVEKGLTYEIINSSEYAKENFEIISMPFAQLNDLRRVSAEIQIFIFGTETHLGQTPAHFHRPDKPHIALHFN